VETKRWRRDLTPRTAIICAFEPELPMIEAQIARPRTRTLNGLRVITGRMAGQPVVLHLCGMSMVNAAMSTQLLIDRFNVQRILVCGIAGGADPALEVGAVAVPARWAQYLEATFVREEAGGYGPDILADGLGLANFGMIFPHAVDLRSGGRGAQRKLWFEADPHLLAIARRLVDDGSRLEVGGSGVSGPVFVDNAAFCVYLFDTFQAQAVDMESAAIAQVAHVNGVPFIAIRGLSDRAGAEVGPNTALVHVDAVAAKCSQVVAAFMAALAD
jgi:adenosylhomocysteine nucleosidase